MLGGKPYFEVKLDKIIYRRFDARVLEEDLVWHRDHNDRSITVKQGQDWQLQFENQLPIRLIENKTYFIGREEYHRLIRGQGDLIVEIVEEE